MIIIPDIKMSLKSTNIHVRTKYLSYMNSGSVPVWTNVCLIPDRLKEKSRRF